MTNRKTSIKQEKRKEKKKQKKKKKKIEQQNCANKIKKNYFITFTFRARAHLLEPVQLDELSCFEAHFLQKLDADELLQMQLSHCSCQAECEAKSPLPKEKRQDFPISLV